MMKNMTLENIAKVCQGVYFGPEEFLKKCVSGICIDSRKLEQNFLFVATKGERVDGHSFVGQVMEKGALCVLVEKEPEMECPYILVKDSFQALKDMATFYRTQLSCKVVGITGSVGKTSTKEMIAGVLSAKYNVQKTVGNLNNEVGVPLTLFSVRPEHEVAVVEMGISDFGEMSRLTAMVKPDIAVITNIGECHLENLGDRDGVLKAKTEIFEGLCESGVAVLNGGDDKLITVERVNGRTPYFYGDSRHCFARDVEDKRLEGTHCTIQMQELEIDADICTPGEHQIINAQAAVCVAVLLNLSKKEIETGISSVRAMKGRGEITRTDKYMIIDESYNANPVSMKATLKLLEMAEGRKIAVLGDMYELGENSDELHEEVGSFAKATDTDVLICIGNHAKYIFKGAKDGDLQTYYFETKDEFLAEKDSILKQGDTLLIKASHGMKFDELIKELVG